MQFESINLEGGIKQVKLIGRLDVKGTNEIDNRFTFAVSSGSTPVLVDLTEMEFLASIGMRMLITSARALTRRGSKLILFNPNPLVEEALVTAGFDQLMPISHDFDQSCEILRAIVTEAGVTEAGVTEAGVTEAGVTEASISE